MVVRVVHRQRGPNDPLSPYHQCRTHVCGRASSPGWIGGWTGSLIADGSIPPVACLTFHSEQEAGPPDAVGNWLPRRRTERRGRKENEMLALGSRYVRYALAALSSVGFALASN